jgi:peroxiredoxin
VHRVIFKSALVLGLMVFVFYRVAFASDPLLQMGMIKPRVRMEAPAFTLMSIDGGQQRISDFKGKIILLNFWATWCPNCREEMPSLEKLWEKYRSKGLVVIAISVDRNRGEIRSFAQEQGLTFPILLDPDGAVRKEYEITALPMTYIIGKDGKISGRMYGSREWAGQEADSLMEHLLQQGM